MKNSGKVTFSAYLLGSLGTAGWFYAEHSLSELEITSPRHAVPSLGQIISVPEGHGARSYNFYITGAQNMRYEVLSSSSMVLALCAVWLLRLNKQKKKSPNQTLQPTPVNRRG